MSVLLWGESEAIADSPGRSGCRPAMVRFEVAVDPRPIHDSRLMNFMNGTEGSPRLTMPGGSTGYHAAVPLSMPLFPFRPLRQLRRRLGAKQVTLRLEIHLIVGGLTVLFVMGVLALEWRGMRESVHEEVVAANRVATQLLQRNSLVYVEQGLPGILVYLQGIGRIRSTEVVLYGEQGRELYRSPASSYKAGRNAPAWFERLVAPAPQLQSFEVPGGRLVTYTNASRAVVDAWDDALVLAAEAGALLVVANALLFWLVGRAVRPFGQIVRALEVLEGGRLDAELPPLAGAEAARIGASFNRMLAGLRHTIAAERRAAQAESRLSDNRELTRWMERRLEEERRLIARELHDELGQSVTAMHSMAVSIAQRTRALDAESSQAARLIADESSRLYEAMHGIIPRLTPLVLDRFGLPDALADLMDRLRRSRPDVAIDLHVDLAGRALSADAVLGLYRAAQEGVTNALRHGHARRIRVDLRASASGATLSVIDDGEGFPTPAAPAAGHHGLRWLRERIEGLGGSLDVVSGDGSSGPRRGVRLEIRVPLEPEAAVPAPETASP